MSEHAHHSAETSGAPDDGRLHEPLTIDVRSLGISLIGLVILVVVSLGLMWGLYSFLDRAAIDENPDVPAMREFSYEPPEPRVDSAQTGQRQVIMGEQTEWLESAGPGRITLEAARKRALKQGVGSIRFPEVADEDRGDSDE